MAEKNATLIISGATALYPRINQTYKFVKNGTKQERVACDPLDDGAEYTMSLALTKAEAGSVYKAMKAEYTKKKQDKWDEFPASSEVFELNDNGEYVIRTKLKGAFNKEVTRVDQLTPATTSYQKTSCSPLVQRSMFSYLLLSTTLPAWMDAVCLFACVRSK